MSAARLLRFALLTGVLASAAMPAIGRAQVYEGRQLVESELLANTSAAVPGEPFVVGVLLKMAPGWHTYWKFPGDAGIPTEIKWQLPAGWKAGEIQWPTPLKIDEPGDIQIYGYHDEVLLTQEITPPASLAETKSKLSADVTWLVCEKICIPGGTTLALELPIAANASPTNEKLFARYQRAVPQPWPDNQAATATWSRGASDLTLRVRSAALANYPALDFFPLPGDKVVVGHPATHREADGVSFTIPIESSEQNLNKLPGIVVFGQSANAERNAWEIGGASSVTASIAAAPSKPAESFGKLLLYGFLGGLILNLMPCVLPVISLKIFGFVRHAGDSRRKIFLSGLSFVAGIFLWFLGLALLLIALKSAGREITWALQFTNPYFVVGMSTLVLVFALNLFGVFEISLPQSASRGLLGWTSREGDAGSFFQGLFATALATPCTAPYLGTALGFALAQSPWIIFLMFAAIAAGMSAPYIILAAQPAWVKFLPKPGAWMEHVKQFMGFLLIATLLFLLAVIGAQRGVEGIIWTSAFLLIVSLACWLKGAFVTPSASSTARVFVSALIILLVCGSGWFFIGGKFAETTSQAATMAANGWQAFTPERLAAARASGRPVFVDFTAAWCITCKFNEGTVLETAEVREAFDRRGIVKLKADWTNGDPLITKMLKQFGRVGVPMYVLYPDGQSEPIVLPELLTKNIVLEKLETIAPQVARK